jgi:protocatechuate 3,4-dioxygenase beta subunit
VVGGHVVKKSVYGWAVLLGILAATLGLVQTRAESGGPQEALRSLTGHVISSQNQPVQKAIVYLKNTKSLVIKTYITEADGSYRFPALSPNVDYEVYADYQGSRSDTKTLSAFDNKKQVNITLKLHSK